MLMKTSLHLAEQSMEQTGIALTQGRTDQFEDVVSRLQFLFWVFFLYVIESGFPKFHAFTFS